MSVANLCLQKEWDEWKEDMEENRRRKWRERVSRLAKVEVSNEEEEGEDDGEEKEADDMDSEDEEVRKDEEIATGESGEEEGEETKGKTGIQRGDEEIKKGDEEEDEDETVKENKAVDRREEEEEEDMEMGNKVREVENEQVDEDEEKEVRKAEEPKEGKEEGENKGGREVMEKEVEEEEEEVSEANNVEEEEKEVENEVERQVKDKWEVNELMEEEEKEEEQEEGEDKFEMDVEVNEEVDEKEDRQAREEERVEEEDDWEEEHQQGGIVHYHQAEQIREQLRGTEDENIQQNQGSTRRENEEEQLSGSEGSDNEDSDLTRSEDECCNLDKMKDEERAGENQYKEPEELEDPDQTSQRNKNGILGAWTSKDVRVEKDKSEYWTIQGEEFPEEEEESTDEEEAERPMNEDTDSYEDVKIYRKDDYLTDMFGTLKEFKDSSLLTDLTLSTEDGRNLHVHSPVLAAVSSLIRERLHRNNVEKVGVDEGKDGDTSAGVRRWSVPLGPEVDQVGLEAVVEFAYTGLIPCLSEVTVHQIKAAAQTLDVPRVLDLCAVEEEQSTKAGGQKKEERLLAAEQMMFSLQSIKQLWIDRVGCDVTLEALGGSLHVHRVILAVWSDYFRSMFTLGMRESHQPCVALPFLLASELEVLIDCSYSGALSLSWKSVFEITSTALQLQYQPVLSLCLNFLQQEINPHCCLDVVSFAEAYELVQLLEVADDFVLRQFQRVACTSKFKDLPAKQLLKYLNSHSLCVSSELVVFNAVVAWIQAKPKPRLRLAKALMKTIHFPLMTFKEFKEVQSLNMWSDHSLAELYEAVFEDFCSNDKALQSQCRIYLPKESLVLIGGDQTSEDLGSRSISRELWFGNSLRNHTGIKKAMEWRRLGEIPEPARYRHEVTVLKGQLYVFGGKKYYGINDTLSSVYRYDPLQNSWERLAEMQEKRCSFSVVVLEGKIYAIGGYCDPDYKESVEQYCPAANSWSFTWPLDLPLSGHVAKVHEGQIFVSGGLNSDYQCLASMFLYHPETGSTYLANMAEPRAHHCMETLGGCLYVAGGITTDCYMTIVDQLACEVYSPVANCWTAYTSLQVPHVGAGSAVLEGKFYVLGGYSQEDYSDTKMVHRYDPTTQRWENMGKMPGPNNDIRASVLDLPPHFRL